MAVTSKKKRKNYMTQGGRALIPRYPDGKKGCKEVVVKSAVENLVKRKENHVKREKQRDAERAEKRELNAVAVVNSSSIYF